MANAGSTMGQDVATGSCIQALPQQLINQIAAGEVVERPASVVKELAENALDAGATRVEIQISADARTIRVADNGVGMTAADLRLAFQNHATSKIRTLDDLFHISTLGFRGEALASIAAIAQVTCQTRTATAEAGLEATFDPSGQPIIQPVGCAAGTVMHVNDLFYNTPARLKFMKRASTEVAHIQEWVENLALGHPHVQWELRLQDRTVLKTTGKTTPLLSADGEELKTSSLLVSATQQVFKLSAEVPLIPFAAEDPSAGFAMSGVLGPPDQTKSTKRWMVVMVNQRIIRCPLLLKAIESAFETLLPHGRYPIAVLQLTLPADQIDVNVHPTKREIRYAQGGAVYSFVQVHLKRALEASGLARPWAPVDLLMGQSSYASGHHAWVQSRPWGLTDGLPGNDAGPAGVGYQVQAYDAANQLYRPVDNFSSMSRQGLLGQRDSSTPENHFSGPGVTVIGQLFQTYILLETPQGLMVVDQHIASERTVFESLSRSIQAESPSTQHRLTGAVIPLSAQALAVLEANQATIESLGFAFRVNMSDPSVQLTAVPTILENRQPEAQFEALIQQLTQSAESQAQLDLTNMVATLACHSAVRAGDVLSKPQMEAIVAGWLACTLPWTCPHGRPIAHTIHTAELNRFFERPSLPVGALQGAS